MGKGGAMKKIILAGTHIELSSDNDAQFTKGGRYVTEKQDTTGDPYFLIDLVSGILAGLEGRNSFLDQTFKTFDDMAQKCANEGPVSCIVIMADGQKYTAAGGVMIMPDDAPGGMVSTREGKLPFSVHPVQGKFIGA